MKRLLFIPSVLILLAVIWYSNPSHLWAYVSHADVLVFGAALAISVMALTLRVVKWWILVEKVKFADIFPVQVFGLVFSNFTPGKIAEPTKALILKAIGGPDISRTLPTIVWERILDLI